MYVYPGVFLQEIPALVTPIDGVPTSSPSSEQRYPGVYVEELATHATSIPGVGTDEPSNHHATRPGRFWPFIVARF
jgi:hypothetical protein